VVEGECQLQDFSYRYGRGYSRLDEPKNIKPDKDHIGDQITLFTDRCIMCSRCVRFTREVSGSAELQVINRGSDSEIDIFPGQPCNNKLAGNVVDLCPVGALCSKDFLYKQRVWWLQTTESVCPGCSTGCSVNIDQNEDVVYRLTPRENPRAQGYFMCDDGRFGWKYLQSEDRLRIPELRRDGNVISNDWETVLSSLRKELTQFGKSSASEVAVVLSPWMTVEEAYLLASYVRSVAPQARFALAPVRSDGLDDVYPKDVLGNAIEPALFTIRAEKCPNRRGVEAVLNHFSPDGYGTLSDVLNRAAKNNVSLVYLVGGDPEGWITDQEAKALSNVKVVVVQDILPSPALKYAHVVMPAASFAEREGTFVNHAGLAQEIHRSIRGPSLARPDGRILWELAGRSGLFQAPQLRKEIAGSIPAFAEFASGSLGSLGVVLNSMSSEHSPVSSIHG
jgi:NADH-quinone oxidoreductase subunit G